MINFIIGFIVGAMLMMCAIAMVAIQKDKKLQNNVHFYVTRDLSKRLYLWYGKPKYKNGEWVKGFYNCDLIAGTDTFYSVYGIFPKDYFDMKPGEIREVFLNSDD